MKVWITTYALTTGIEEVDGRTYAVGTKQYFDPHIGVNLIRPKDWHRTKDEAIARAEEMRTAKIASLRRSIAKLEKLRFT